MAKEEKLIKARCLQSFRYDDLDYSSNQIYTGTQADIINLAGLVDPHIDAIKYAENIK